MPIETNAERLRRITEENDDKVIRSSEYTYAGDEITTDIDDDFDWLIERVRELEVMAEGYRSNWYKCANDKTGSNQELKITPKGSVNAPWG